MTFEAFVFVFSTMALGLQYINLYKTVWWLPQSHSTYALNFYMIDPYLCTLLVIINSRRVLYAFIKEFYFGRSHWALWTCMIKGVKVVMSLAVVQMLCICMYQVIDKYSISAFVYLLWPLVTYIVLFHFQLLPLFGKGEAILPAAGTPRHKARESSREIPVHVCDINPDNARIEVEYLKTDFNARIKQGLFNSMACAYYMGLVPLCFADSSLYYDIWWAGQHFVLVWVSSFVMFMVHLLPPKYLDTLHCSALHLGKWIKVEGRNAHVPYNAWSELQVWPKGATVKHVKGLFKAEGVNNAAEPGNSMHARFHFMFYYPCRVTNWLLCITSALVMYQFWLLLCSTEWSHIVSLALMLFFDYYMLFKLLRDRFVMQKTYPSEEQNVS